MFRLWSLKRARDFLASLKRSGRIAVASRHTRTGAHGVVAAGFGYTYDAVGNRLTQNASGTVISYTYDIANRLMDVNGRSYTWDDNGNLLNDGLQTYTYDQANRLKTAVQSGTTYSFGYNGVGDRLSQTVGVTTTRYVLDPAAGLTQVLSDGTSTYLYGNDRLAQYQAEMQYFGADGLGSVRQIYDASAQVIGTTRYDPYGSVMSQGGATSVFAFAGEQEDATGLQYLRARYYSAAQGRFLTRDVWDGDPNAPMSYNAWLYVYGNSVNLTDPDGGCAAPLGQPPGADWKIVYMTYTSSDRGYTGNLSLYVGHWLYTSACQPCQLSIESHAWGAVSGNPGIFDPIPPDTYIVDPGMRRNNDSWGRGTCLGSWCPFGMKWNEDSWGKERLSLKYETGEGAPYFIHGGNETRGTAGCIKVKNSDLTEVLDEIQSVGRQFKLLVSSDYSEPEPPPDWTGRAPP